MSRPRPATILLTASLLLAAAAHGIAAPRSNCLVDAWAGKYPNASVGGATSLENAGCQLCHGSAGYPIVNAYGLELALAVGTKDQRLELAESKDSDGDSFANICEIVSGTQPGWTNDGTDEVFDLLGEGDADEPAPASIQGLMTPTAVQVGIRHGIGTVNCLSSTIAPVISGSWRISVDSSLVPNATSVFVVCFAEKLEPGLLYPAGELLVDVTSAFFFRGGQAANPQGPNVFDAAIAPDVAMVGIRGSAQAALRTARGGFVLSNALDVVVGYPVCSHGGGGG